MDHDDAHVRASTGGTFAFESGSGCWLTDGLGLLDDGFDGMPYTVTHVAWQRGATVGAVSFHHGFDLAAAVRHLGGGDRHPGIDQGMPAFLRHLGWARRVAADANWMPGYVGPHLPGDGDQATRVARFAAELSAAVRAVDPFLATLDPDAVAACHREGGPEDDAEYAGFDRTLDTERALARAVEAIPLMRDTLAEMHGVDRVAITDAVVGRGEPLRDVVHGHLARTLGRRCAKVAMHALGILEGLDDATRAHVLSGLRCASDPPVQVARDLSSLPASWAPRTVDGFLDLAACHPAVRHAVLAAARGHAGSMLNARGDWAAYRLRLAKACGTRGPVEAGELGRALRDVDDMADSFARQVMVPAMAKAAGVGPADGKEPRVSVGRIHVPWHMARRMLARSLVQEGRTLAATLEASRRWHAGRWRLLEALPGREGLPNRWPAGMPPASHGGVDIVPLTDAGQLEDEGAPGRDRDGMAGLNHCVGGHAGACLSGASRVVSLRAERDGGRVRLSTAEFRPGRGGPEMVQHSGRDNADPPAEAGAALDAYVADILAGRLAADVEAWQPVEAGDPVTLAAGYDWATDGNWELALAAWSPFLPGLIRTATFADLVGRATGSAPDGHDWRKPLDR